MLHGEGSQRVIDESKGSLSVFVALIKWVLAVLVKNVRMACLIFAESSFFLWTVLGLDFWLLDHTIRFLRPGCAHIPLPQIEALMDLGVSICRNTHDSDITNENFITGTYGGLHPPICIL